MNHLRIPVTLNTKTTLAVVKPAETVSSMENFLAIATAAIAFETVSSHDRNGFLVIYLHRLYRQWYAKSHPSENIPEPGEYQGCGK